MAKKSPVLNVDDVELRESPVPIPEGLRGKFGGVKMALIASKIGAQKLGYNLTVVPPGRRAFPFHSHRVNEEMFFVLEGTGELRFGAEVFPVRKGDVIACPPSGPEAAHQIINTGEGELRYLAVSTKLSPEIADYPDSSKFGVLAQVTDENGEPTSFRFLGRADQSMGYWDDEPEG